MDKADTETSILGRLLAVDGVWWDRSLTGFASKVCRAGSYQ